MNHGFNFPSSSARPNIDLAPTMSEEEIKNMDYNFDAHLFQDSNYDDFLNDIDFSNVFNSNDTNNDPFGNSDFPHQENGFNISNQNSQQMIPDHQKQQHNGMNIFQNQQMHPQQNFQIFHQNQLNQQQQQINQIQFNQQIQFDQQQQQQQFQFNQQQLSQQQFQINFQNQFHASQLQQLQFQQDQFQRQIQQQQLQLQQMQKLLQQQLRQNAENTSGNGYYSQGQNKQPNSPNIPNFNMNDFGINDFNTLAEYEVNPDSYIDYTRNVNIDDIIELQKSDQRMMSPHNRPMQQSNQIPHPIPKEKSRKMSSSDLKKNHINYAIPIPLDNVNPQYSPMKTNYSAPIPRSFEKADDTISFSDPSQIPADSEYTFQAAFNDPNLVFCPLQLGFEPHEYWLFQDRKISFRDLVLKFFRHTKTNQTKFMYKLYDMLRLTTCYPQLKQIVGVYFVNDYVIVAKKNSLINMLGINPKNVDGSLFHKQGNFSTHGFIEVNERNYTDVGFETKPEVDIKEARLLFHKDFKFVNRVMKTKELDSILYENESKKYYGKK